MSDEMPSKQLADMSLDSAEPIQCGEQAAREFMFAPGYTNLNHGSFGAIPRSVNRVQRAYQDASEQRPDIFIRYTSPPLLTASREAIAAYLSCPRSSVVFVPNATTGMNTVLRNLVYEEGDVAIYFSTIYGAIEKTLLYLSETTPLELHGVKVTQPQADSAVLEAFEDAIRQIEKARKKPRLAVFDTISSMPGVRWPFEALVKACKTHGILSVIDGAHSVGQIPLSLTELDPDFYTSNCHKWLYVPRPCAVLYVAQRDQHLMRSSLPTSHNFVPRDLKDLNTPLPRSDAAHSVFETTFEFIGTLDSTAYLCVPAALEWRKRIRWQDKKGEYAIYSYMRNQAQEAGHLLAKALGTEVMENPEETLQDCAFSMVRLPLDYASLAGSSTVDPGKVMRIARAVEKLLVDQHDTFVAIIFHGGAYWIRLSAQIYLTLDDWEKAAVWLRDACKKVQHGVEL